MSVVRIKKTNEFFALSPDGRRHRIQEFRTITRPTLSLLMELLPQAHEAGAAAV